MCVCVCERESEQERVIPVVALDFDVAGARRTDNMRANGTSQKWSIQVAFYGGVHFWEVPFALMLYRWSRSISTEPERDAK